MNFPPDTPWKYINNLQMIINAPVVRGIFWLNNIEWGSGWKFFGVPVIQKHRQSLMKFGRNLQLRSSLRSNPLAPNHPVFLTTWEAGAEIIIGDNFGMTGGVICAAQSIKIGNNVIIGANSTVIDTDFHPVSIAERKLNPARGNATPIIVEDNVFVGMNSLILKGVRIGAGSTIGAGSVVTKDVPAGVIAAGNPARVIASL